MIVLRFSDYEADTIKEHRAILADAGEVWWGWWKKLHEPTGEDLLSGIAKALRAEESVNIGLLDRADGRFFRASCVELVFQAGVPERSPNPELVPSYYGARAFPAWFRFTKIATIDEEQWVAEFGAVPAGDSTLYARQRKRPVSGSVVLEANGKAGQSGILHISDLHFGSDHGYHPEPHSIRASETLVRRIVGSLQVKPVCLVVSGDLTTRGESEGLTSARLFIEDLARELEIDTNAVIIAPGNHDILIDDPLVTRDFSNEQAFRDQLQLFYGTKVPNERVHDIRDDLGRHLIIGVLNSSRPRRKETMDYGYVGDDRSEPVFRTIGQLSSQPRESAWTAVVMHHHVVPAPIFEEPEDNRPVSLSLDAGELVSFAQEHGVSAILHGHQHLPFIAGLTRYAECTPSGPTMRPASSVHVLGAGSAGVAPGPRLPEELGVNTLSLYEPFSRDGLRVSCIGFGRKRDPHELWSFVV